jgi:hypothetical protein
MEEYSAADFGRTAATTVPAALIQQGCVVDGQEDAASAI